MCSRTGGFGTQLAKTLVDDLVFNDARNAVTMVKYLNSSQLLRMRRAAAELTSSLRNA